MEELIKRLERVIQTGVPDEDGMHPISAETVLEVVNELSEHGTNLAEVGTDCISRQAAIDTIEDFPHGDVWNVESMEEMVDRIKQLPPIQPVNCSEFPNNSDTISRQAAITQLSHNKNKGDDECELAVENDIQTIWKLPSAEPKRIRGKWIEYEQEFMLEGPLETVQKTVKECSVCTTKIAGMVGIMNFCPNCGAKMEVTE